MSTISSLDPLLSTTLIHQFPLPTWIENLAIRSNGTILATLLTTPELYLIDPKAPPSATLVANFPEVSGLTGIIEVQPDIFYIAGGNFNLATFANEAGSYWIWEVDMRSFDTDHQAKIRKVANLPEAGLPNGFELLSRDRGIIMIADSEIGSVWKLNVKDGKHEIAIQVDEMKPPPPPGLPMGINGIKIRDGYLYWTNTGEKTFCRVRIDEYAKAVGDVEVLERDTLVDDFVFDDQGNAWLAQNVMNVIGVRKDTGGVVMVAGAADQLTVAGATSCQFGRTEEDRNILYVATSGGLAAPINGTVVEGGKVVAVDTSSFRL
ncbi:hypothetical protein DL95DRAFT_447912 [Leptodontidium sp. 2 PMI_412]|nr:hypothetical protein BKA61DRAFT_14376 [Leptodontidium sp. MPI-SDFR-AT-0119]KAH9212112.1 hypothetical protein DL95DRAFT_447912 [Leptodontidium sp. 2 PMI_412]